MGVHIPVRKRVVGSASLLHKPVWGDVERTYAQKVLALGPIAYWPLWESSGTTAQCLVNSAQNGTYNSDVSTWPVADGIGDGNTAPGFDGANDYVNVNTVTLEGLWNAGGAECSILIWAKVFNVGVWTDGNYHGCYRFRRNVSNYAFAQKTNVNNQFQFSWAGGGTAEVNNEAGMTTVDWQCLVMTRSETADEVKYYRNGGLLATDNTIGVWASATPWENQVIGAVTVLPNAPWHGWLAHCAVWMRALSLPEIQSLAIV